MQFGNAQVIMKPDAVAMVRNKGAFSSFCFMKMMFIMRAIDLVVTGGMKEAADVSGLVLGLNADLMFYEKLSLAQHLPLVFDVSCLMAASRMEGFVEELDW